MPSSFVPSLTAWRPRRRARAQRHVLSWIAEPTRSHVLDALERAFEGSGDGSAAPPGRREALMLDIIAHAAGVVPVQSSPPAARARSAVIEAGGTAAAAAAAPGDDAADEAAQDGVDARGAALMSAYLALLSAPGEGQYGAGMAGGDAALMCVRPHLAAAAAAQRALLLCLLTRGGGAAT